MRVPSLVAFAITSFSGCALFEPPPQEDPVAIQLAELERRLESVERVVNNQSLVQMAQKVSEIERRADQLQGRDEELQYEAEDTAERQRILYADLDARIQELERSLQVRNTNVLEGGTLPPGQLPVPGGSDRDNYQAAFELLKEERYDMAAASFKEFLAAFPDSELVDNAQYWLAESYYASNDYEQALRDFQVVIDDHPRSSKVPDALLKMGLCNYNLKRWNEARATLSRVQQDYAETTAARLAGQYLGRMDSEGV
ncbi:MAG: tol-pal system protein YbgF [Woeseiaceae bacterium]|nr:tol-pal system protein YbgF [Woeseiaceae bacterium]NIP19881.1 tol-pal system protein YbgF [Woeseiaceae bacterium]NIS88682.1 tol-pal system protein YbgF [Woeseiaceae bacterium]